MSTLGVDIAGGKVKEAFTKPQTVDVYILRVFYDRT